MNDFITPPGHVNFRARKLFGQSGEIIDGALAYLEKQGGGPVENHTHRHNHLFIVTEGEAKVILDDQEVIIGKNESFLVRGDIPHSVWNNIDDTTVMIGLSVV
jgi:quercetin dioxygenase-like cupin family protein